MASFSSDYKIKLGEELTATELDIINKIIELSEGEYINLAYWSGETITEKSIIVLITNYNFLKVDNGIKTVIHRPDCISTKRVNCGIGHWNNIVCVLKNGSVKNISIYPTEAAQQFNQYLKTNIPDYYLNNHQNMLKYFKIVLITDMKNYY